MNSVNREFVKKLWMLVHARQSIALALEAYGIVCAEWPDQSIGPFSVAFKCAVTTMYISYARPFGNNKGLVRLNYEDSIPDHLRETHKLMLDYRKKAIAHKDKSNNPVCDAVDHVEIHVSNGKTRLAPIIHTPGPKELTCFPELAKVVLTLIARDMKDCYDQCIKPLNLSDGVYRLDPTKDDWLVPTEATPGLFEITRGADPITGEC